MDHDHSTDDILFEQKTLVCTRDGTRVVLSCSGAHAAMGVFLTAALSMAGLMGIVGLIGMWWIRTQWEPADPADTLPFTILAGMMMLTSVLVIGQFFFPPVRNVMRRMLPQTITIDAGDLHSILCTTTMALFRAKQTAVARPATIHIVPKNGHGRKHVQLDLRGEDGAEVRLVRDIGEDEANARACATKLAAALECEVA